MLDSFKMLSSTTKAQVCNQVSLPLIPVGLKGNLGMTHIRISLAPRKNASAEFHITLTCCFFFSFSDKIPLPLDQHTSRTKTAIQLGPQSRSSAFNVVDNTAYCTFFSLIMAQKWVMRSRNWDDFHSCNPGTISRNDLSLERELFLD